jgi:hypothetical protein
MSSYYAVLGLSMAGGGLLVDFAGARVAWAFAGGVYLVAAVTAFILTRRIREAGEPGRAPAGEPAGLARIRALMDEIEETRRREQHRARPDVAVLAPPEPERRPTP